jgi:hypothetical protein
MSSREAVDVMDGSINTAGDLVVPQEGRNELPAMPCELDRLKAQLAVAVQALFSISCGQDNAARQVADTALGQIRAL